MNRVTLNRDNWTGEVVTVEYDDAGRFEDLGEKWKVTLINLQKDGDAVWELTGDGWTHPLQTFYIEADSIHQQYHHSLDKAVRSAVVWISNYI